MAANAPAVYGLFSQETALQEVVRALNQAGFRKEDICIMLSPKHPIASVVRAPNLFNQEKGFDADNTVTMEWLYEFGAVLIPTVGFFIQSQAYFRALLASEDNSSFCCNSRALVGLGFSELEAKKYERQLRNLGVIIYVSCPESDRMDRATELLRRTGAREASAITAAIARPEAAISAVA